MTIKCCLVAIVAIVCAAITLPDNSGSVQDNNPLMFDEVRHTLASRSAPLRTTFEELELWSENIVRGRILNDARMVFQFNSISQPTVPTMGHNFVSLEILEVFKGDLSVGDIITLAEPYRIINGVLITPSNYLPSIPYQEYFFFLSEQRTNPEPADHYGIFWLEHDYRSRFHIPNNRADIAMLSRNAESLVLATTYISRLPMERAIFTANETYVRLWQDVIEAYMDWRRPAIPSFRFQAESTSLQEATQYDFGGVR